MLAKKQHLIKVQMVNDDWWLKNLPKDEGCEQGDC